MDRRLEPAKIRKVCDEDVFQFETTAEVPRIEGLIGQERAVKALRFGLSVKGPGYNIFVSGPPGTGRTTYTVSMVKQTAENERTPSDWCYVYNFADEYRPIALPLPSGQGKEFKKDMEDLVEDLREEFAKAFGSEEYERQREHIVRKYQEAGSDLLRDLEKAAQQQGFMLGRTPSGLAPIPASGGKALTAEDIEAMSEEERKALEERGRHTQALIQSVLHKAKELEERMKSDLKKLDSQIAAATVEPLVLRFSQKYWSNERITAYLGELKNHVISNVELFQTDKDKETGNLLQRSGPPRDPFANYRVNLFVYNGELRGAPVVVETNPTYQNLFGRIEYRGQFGVVTTDHTMIKAGSLHRANGGYLILQAQDLLKAGTSWDALKRCLKNNEVRIESVDQSRAEATVSLQPEPIPVSVKVVLIGYPSVYRLLHAVDEDFRKLFKVKAEFDVQMERTPENIHKYAQFISSICHREDIKHFRKCAVARVVEYSSRLVEDQRALSTRFNDVIELIYEASQWAELDGEETVLRRHVDRALEEKEYRSDLIYQKIKRLIQRGTISLDVKGKAVGQVNGLSVYDLGDYVFGKPTRITARSFVGRGGIINIEREAEMSGRIYNKGVMILSGYVGQQYAQDKPLALSASICMEQVYEDVEGDSASAAELCALLSSISGIPLNQGIAVTGSVNQYGYIQPVGGVTRKIEGFFEVCKLFGLTGDQGVVIPYRNIDNLMLRDDVVQAVSDGLFSIYAVEHIDEALEILSGIEAGIRTAGGFKESSFHHRVDLKLKEWAEIGLSHRLTGGRD
ncbi:MAG: ATP-binding protein [Bacillota bacterium]